MNKGHIYFEIQADDPARAVHFYSQVFDWKFDEVKGLPISSSGRGTKAFVCSVEVESFDSTRKTIEQLGRIVALGNSPYRTPAGGDTL